jgi:multidrug transporter EmrE-like cation transporter
LWDYPDGPWDAERNSIAFAVIIGAIFLHERLSLMRLTSITTTLIGTMVLKLSR